MMNRNSKKISILKTVTWRTFSTSLGICLVYYYTDSIEFGLTFGLADVIISAAYYAHERLWERKYSRETGNI